MAIAPFAVNDPHVCVESLGFPHCPFVSDGPRGALTFLLLSAAWSVSDTAACPKSARMRAFPPDDPEKFGCVCPWAGKDVRAGWCSCGNAGSAPPPSERYSS